MIQSEFIRGFTEFRNSPMKQILFCGVFLVAVSALAAEQVVHVVDAEGKPVDRFQITWHTSDQGHSVWQEGHNGVWKDLFPPQADAIQIVARADGFASTV